MHFFLSFLNSFFFLFFKLSSSLAYLSIDSFISLVFDFCPYLYCLDIKPLVDTYLVKIVFYSVDCLLGLLNVSLAVQKLFVFLISLLLYSTSVPMLVEFYWKSPCYPSILKCTPVFACKSFSILGFKLRPLIHFELIFVHGEAYKSNFILLQGKVQVASTIFLNKLSFLQRMFLSPLSKIKWA